MAIRRREVHPGEDGLVALDDLIRATVDALGVQDLAGGVVSVVVDRAPTRLPGEMVTVGAVVEWRDRTDAKSQAEPVASGWRNEPAPAPVSEPVPEPAAESVVYEDGEPVEDVDLSTLPAPVA